MGFFFVCVSVQAFFWRLVNFNLHKALSLYSLLLFWNAWKYDENTTFHNFLCAAAAAAAFFHPEDQQISTFLVDMIEWNFDVKGRKNVPSCDLKTKQPNMHI